MNPALLHEALRALSAAFHTKDAEGLLSLFSDTPSATYAGSEPGEKATGPRELRHLIGELFARPVAYSFEFPDITFSEQQGMVWLLADGQGTQTGDDGTTESFPYRLAGVLVHEDARWRWQLLACSEPTAGAAPS